MQLAYFVVHEKEPVVRSMMVVRARHRPSRLPPCVGAGANRTLARAQEVGFDASAVQNQLVFLMNRRGGVDGAPATGPSRRP